jgi:phosphate transport system permease protein
MSTVPDPDAPPLALARLAGRLNRTAVSDHVYLGVAWVAGGTGALIPIAILAYLLWNGWSAVTWDFLTTPPAGGSLDGRGGIAPAIAGSLALVGCGLVPAVILGVGGGIYLAEFNRSPWLEGVARFSIESLAAVPGLVYSLFGYALLVVTLQLKMSLLAGAVTLGFVMLPQILIGAHESLRAVDPAQREAALALGVSQAHMIARVAWPVAWPGILTSIVLSAVHALGAAAPLLFTAATVFTKEPVGLTKPVMALPTHLYFVTSEIGAVPYAFGTALVLAGLVLSISIIAVVFKKKHR